VANGCHDNMERVNLPSTLGTLIATPKLEDVIAPDSFWRRHVLVKYPGGLFMEPGFSTFAVFVIDFIPQITVVLHLSQSSISLKSTRVLFTGYVKNLSGTLFFSALSVLHNFCSELGEVFVGTVFPSPLPSANMRPNLAIEQD